jgi:hypothetical protein
VETVRDLFFFRALVIHLNRHAHPRMNAALKEMVAFCEAGDLELAALQDARAGHRNVLKTAGTFGNGCFA